MGNKRSQQNKLFSAEWDGSIMSDLNTAAAACADRVVLSPAKQYQCQRKGVVISKSGIKTIGEAVVENAVQLYLE